MSTVDGVVGQGWQMGSLEKSFHRKPSRRFGAGPVVQNTCWGWNTFTSVFPEACSIPLCVLHLL